MQHKSEESVFNMAIAYLMRIDKLLYRCQESAIRQDVNDWRQNLRAVYRELSVKLTPEEETSIEGNPSKPIDVNDLLNKEITYDEATFVNINYLANNLEIMIKKKGTVLLLLDKLEIKMRKLLQKKGMLLPSKDDPRYAVLKR